MKKRMLIDATHVEETRVAVLEDNRLVDFDYESELRKPLKGSIFLAKVTRVEPSLQAAFVNFGGNRHGFLPFSEIHPDYFRIPIADREALMAEQEAALAEAEAQEEAEEQEEEQQLKSEDTDENTDTEEGAAQDGKDQSKSGSKSKSKSKKKASKPEQEEGDEAEDDVDGNLVDDSQDDDSDEDDDDSEDANKDNNRRGRGRGGRGRGRKNHRSKGAQRYDDNPERRFRFNLRRKYKIQEVIKRGQIMLVQVNKEERGNKGAAVGSYLSLPGRYCVLMPNSPRAGGVSRKIANFKDRRRMREIMKELEVPKGMSVILRTAGLQRTKSEIKRDLDYLIKLWNNIRELTLESSAPALVYQEADLIKRSVRDLYTRDVEEIVVAGKEGHKTAKNFMKMMIPSHAKRVKEFVNKGVPLFNKYKVESQIAEIGETQVTLPSGGYLVINPTEALVSVDVNSGKSTKERHIEETALRTNLEAAEEVARQLRLRDLGGLVVIDFIDMEDRRNNGKVERKMRDALSSDRARVQVGRISSFGLMELSRQRLSPSLTESQYETCSHCTGTGRIRTPDAATIMVLRAIEDEGIKGRAAEVMVHVTASVAIYILNSKRDHITALEERYGFKIVVRADESVGASGFRVEVSKPANKAGNSEEEDSSENNDSGRSSGGRRRGRRGGRRRGGRSDNETNEDNQDSQSDNQNIKSDDDAKSRDKSQKDEKPKRGRKKTENNSDASKSDDGEKVKAEEKPKKSNAAKKRAPKKPEEDGEVKDEKKSEKEAKPKKESKPKPKAKAKADPKEAKASNDDKSEDKQDAHKEYETVNQAPKKKKKGWWSK